MEKLSNKETLLEKNVPKMKFNKSLLTYNASQLKKYGAKTFKPLSSMKTLEISFDNKIIYTSGYDVEHIIMLDLNKKKFIGNLKGHTDCVFSVHLNRKTNMLMSGGRDTRVIFWKISKVKEETKHQIVRKWGNSKNFIMTVRFTEDGSRAFALNQSFKIFEFRTSDFNMVKSYEGFKYYFNDHYFDVNVNGTNLYGAHSSSPNFLKIEQIKKKRQRIEFFPKIYEINSVKFMKKSRIICSGDVKGGISFLSLMSRKFIRNLRVSNSHKSLCSLAFNKKETLVFAATLRKSVFIFKIDSQNKISRLTNQICLDYSVECVKVSPDSKKLLIGGQSMVKVYPLVDKIGVSLY